MFYLIKCVFQIKEDLNLSVFNMIMGINKSKTLTKDISCACKCKFDGRKCNLDQWWNNDKCRSECKKYRICEKDYVWNPSTCNCKKRKYLPSIIDKTICDEIIDVKETNFNEKQKFSIFYLPFY